MARILANHFPKSVALCGLLLLLAPFCSARFLGLFILAFLYGTMALGLNLVVGYCRLFDLGFAGFVCIGAYTTGILMVRAGWPYLLATILAVVVAALSGVVLGLPTLRLQGDYFAIVTFGFAELVVLLIRNWQNLTGGTFGFGGIPNPEIFGLSLKRYPPIGYVYLAGTLAVCVTYLVHYLRHTQLGLQMIAVGESRALSTTSGVDIVGVKVAAFAISAGIGGLAGSFWAVYYKFLSYLDFTLLLSVQVLTIVVLASRRGPAAVLAMGMFLGPASEFLRIGLRSVGFPPAAWLTGFGLLLIWLSRWNRG